MLASSAFMLGVLTGLFMKDAASRMYEPAHATACGAAITSARTPPRKPSRIAGGENRPQTLDNRASSGRVRLVCLQPPLSPRAAGRIRR